jgi:hypothetical protein
LTIAWLREHWLDPHPQIPETASGLHADARLSTEHLRELGIGSIKEAKQIWTHLGRTAQLPWLLPEVQEMHPYIDPLNIILMPPAHNLLRGLTSKIVSFIVKTSERDLRKLGLSPLRHPLVLSNSQQTFVKVHISPRRLLDHTKS